MFRSHGTKICGSSDDSSASKGTPRRGRLARACEAALGRASLVGLSTLVSACVLAPAGLDDERESLERRGGAYERPLEEREIPPLPAAPTWRDVLQRAFLVNGEIEVAWQEWRAALARVTAESTWPMPNLELGLEYMFSDENMTSWDRTSAMLGFDAMDAFDWPSETRTRGRVALAEARAAGERFRAAKFALQRRFFEAWIEWRAMGQRARLARESVTLLALASDATERAASSGGDERELLRARAESLRATDALARIEAQRTRLALELGALAGLDDVRLLDGATDEGPFQGEWARAPIDDARLFAAAAEANPMLAELAREVEGRADALELARAAWWPDIRPSAGFTGGIEQFVGLSLTLPTATPVIRARIEEARASLDGARARARQARTDVRAALVSEIVALRDAERAAGFLDGSLVPLLERLSASARTAYAGGRADQRDWLEALRMELEARDASIEAHAARATSLARLEEILGSDWEPLARAEVRGAAAAATTTTTTTKHDVEVSGG